MATDWVGLVPRALAPVVFARKGVALRVACRGLARDGLFSAAESSLSVDWNRLRICPLSMTLCLIHGLRRPLSQAFFRRIGRISPLITE